MYCLQKEGKQQANVFPVVKFFGLFCFFFSTSSGLLLPYYEELQRDASVVIAGNC